jgi:hypothetical protein
VQFFIARFVANPKICGFCVGNDTGEVFGLVNFHPLGFERGRCESFLIKTLNDLDLLTAELNAMFQALDRKSIMGNRVNRSLVMIAREAIELKVARQ